MPGDQNSFGLSEISPTIILGAPVMATAPIAKGDTDCTTDFIEVSTNHLDLTRSHFFGILS